MMHRFATLALLGLALMGGIPAATAQEPPLRLSVKIPLGKVSGRIDHLAVDLGRKRLFVAELGNDSVGVIGLKERQVIRRIDGLKEPQGLGYEPSTDTLYVANGGDGSVRLFQGTELKPSGQIDLGEDADNIRVDAERHRVLVGYGNGAIATIDPRTRAKTGVAILDGHPEGFQTDGTRIFANVPDGRHIALLEETQLAAQARWRFGETGRNFPMAIDDEERRLLVVTRGPAELLSFNLGDGALLSRTDSCEDADDAFVDTKRHRIYVSCGEGFLDIFERRKGYERIARIPTPRGARTSFFSPSFDRLFLAVRATFAEPAAIWVYEPAP
jgi:hypothetical protein